MKRRKGYVNILELFCEVRPHPHPGNSLEIHVPGCEQGSSLPVHVDM